MHAVPPYWHPRKILWGVLAGGWNEGAMSGVRHNGWRRDPQKIFRFLGWRKLGGMSLGARATYAPYDRY